MPMTEPRAARGSCRPNRPVGERPFFVSPPSAGGGPSSFLLSGGRRRQHDQHATGRSRAHRDVAAVEGDDERRRDEAVMRATTRSLRRSGHLSSRQSGRRPREADAIASQCVDETTSPSTIPSHCREDRRQRLHEQARWRRRVSQRDDEKKDEDRLRPRRKPTAGRSPERFGNATQFGDGEAYARQATPLRRAAHARLRSDADGQLALQDPGRRPRHGRKRHIARPGRGCAGTERETSSP